MENVLMLEGLWVILITERENQTKGRTMYLSNITIPRITNETLAQMEALAPGITAFPGISVILTSEDAVEVATSQLRDVLHYSESVGGVESLTETGTGWDIQLRVTTQAIERR